MTVVDSLQLPQLHFFAYLSDTIPRVGSSQVGSRVKMYDPVTSPTYTVHADMTAVSVPGESLFDERDPHLVGVDGPGAPWQPRVDADGQIVVDVDVVPATEPPEPTVEHSVVLRRADTVRIFRQDLHARAAVSTALAGCGAYNHDSTSIRRPFDCLSKDIKNASFWR